MALFLLPSLIQVVLDPIASPIMGVLFACVSVIPLAWRRSLPSTAAVVGAGGWLIPTDGFLYLGYLIAVILLFSVGAHVSSLRRVIAVTGWASLAAVVGTLQGPEPPYAVLAALLVVIAPVITGLLLARERARSRRLSELTEQLEAEHDLSRRTVVAEERARIARELHDVVGHEVTLIALQSEAAAAALDRAPALARGPIEVIRETAHRTLAEMRDVLGMMREEDLESATPPQPDDIATLTQRAPSLGITAALEVTGDASDAPSALRLAVYRIVQESLTNAGRHAPGSAVAVNVAWDERGVKVRVRNPAAAARPGSTARLGSGRGVSGMKERVRYLGGEITAGLTRSGDYVVAADLPARHPSPVLRLP